LKWDSSKATSRELNSKGPDKWEAYKKLRARKEELKELADDDDIIKHNKHHTANLLLRPSTATLDCDVVTVAVHAQPLHQFTPNTSIQAQARHVTHTNANPI
jgi:hypothetical protein